MYVCNEENKPLGLKQQLFLEPITYRSAIVAGGEGCIGPSSLAQVYILMLTISSHAV